MKFLYQAELLSMLVVSSLVCGQASTKSTTRSGASPLEVKVTEGPPPVSSATGVYAIATSTRGEPAERLSHWSNRNTTFVRDVEMCPGRPFERGRG
jgi:hypothetical protein